MLYDKRSPEDRKSRELELLQNTLSEVDASYTWRQIKELVQSCVFPRCEKFGTWSSNGVGADRVPNRKVSTQKEESSVLGPQRARKHGSSPEQESTNSKPYNSFSAWSSKRVRRESRQSPEKESTHTTETGQAQQFQQQPLSSQQYFQPVCPLVITCMNQLMYLSFGTYVKPLEAEYNK